MKFYYSYGIGNSRKRLEAANMAMNNYLKDDIQRSYLE